MSEQDTRAHNHGAYNCVQRDPEITKAVNTPVLQVCQACLDDTIVEDPNRRRQATAWMLYTPSNLQAYQTIPAVRQAVDALVALLPGMVAGIVAQGITEHERFDHLRRIIDQQSSHPPLTLDDVQDIIDGRPS